jgi:putative addiction module killer protein
MFSIRPLPEFTSWIDGLKDEMVRGVVVARIKRLERGLMGDVEPVGGGVSELRIHFGADGGCTLRSAGRRLLCCWLAGQSERRRTISSERRRWPRG